jgi:hypothetical protein
MKMKQFLTLALVAMVFLPDLHSQCYDTDYVSISEVLHKGDSYNLVTMKRSGGRVKAKYFGAVDQSGNSMAQKQSGNYSLFQWNLQKLQQRTHRPEY